MKKETDIPDFKPGDRIRYQGALGTVQEVEPNGALVLLMDSQKSRVLPSDVRKRRVVHTIVGIHQRNQRNGKGN